MTLDEKIAHLQEVVMTDARAEGNAIIENHRKALESLYEKHKEEKQAQYRLRIQSETTSARRQLNQTAAKAQTELKRALGKCQNELKERLFEEVKKLLVEYRDTEEYLDYLTGCIMKAAVFADGEPLTIYITPDDAEKKDVLEKRTGMTVTVSGYGFLGGIRAVIRKRNILIDRSFQTALEEEYRNFCFVAGGVSVG